MKWPVPNAVQSHLWENLWPVLLSIILTGGVFYAGLALAFSGSESWVMYVGTVILFPIMLYQGHPLAYFLTFIFYSLILFGVLRYRPGRRQIGGRSMSLSPTELSAVRVSNEKVMILLAGVALGIGLSLALYFIRNH